MTNKEFIPYEQALELKELGFDEECVAITNVNSFELKVIYENYNKELYLPTPLYQQAFRWFREKYQKDISINTVYSRYNKILIRNYGGVVDSESVFTNIGFYETYEEAELACLKKLIEIVKSKTT